MNKGSTEMPGEGRERGDKKQRRTFQATGTICAKTADGEDPSEWTHESFIDKTRPGNSLEGNAERMSKWDIPNTYTLVPHLPLECPTKHSSQQHLDLRATDPHW